MAEAAPAEVVKPTEVTPAKDAPAAVVQPPQEPRTYSQEEVDRIAEKVRKNAAYRTKKEAEAYYRGRLEAAAPKTPEAPPPPKQDPEPKRDDFGTWDEYADARAAFIARREARKAQEETEKERKDREAAEARAKRNNDFQARTKEKYPDFEERIASIGDMAMLPEVYEAIAESSVGHDILIHFADSPSDYERIAGLSPSAQIREIGKLEARFESAATPKPEPKTPEAAPAVAANVTRAPAPIAPLKGGSGPASMTIRDNMPYAEFKALRNRQLGRTK